MKKKMNNKGYMLVEIILAFAIAFALIYFMMNLVIDMKNKNDDLLVKTIVTTDQTIITNELMEYAASEEENFDCSQLKLDGKKIIYKEKVINVINDYVDIGTIVCNNSANKITIDIPMSVKQVSDEVFDASVDYRYGSNELVLYSYGWDNTEITGGYEKGEAVNKIGTTSYFDATFTKENDHLKLYSWSGFKLDGLQYWGRGSGWTKNKVDVTNYDYYEITYKTSQEPGSDSRSDLKPYMVVSTEKDSNPIYGISDEIYVAEKGISEATSVETTLSVDISSLTGSYYIGFLNTQTLLPVDVYNHTDFSNQTILVYKIRLYN